MHKKITNCLRSLFKSFYCFDDIVVLTYACVTEPLGIPCTPSTRYTEVSRACIVSQLNDKISFHKAEVKFREVVVGRFSNVSLLDKQVYVTVHISTNTMCELFSVLSREEVTSIIQNSVFYITGDYAGVPNDNWSDLAPEVINLTMISANMVKLCL